MLGVFKLLLLAGMMVGAAAASGNRVAGDMISIGAALKMFNIHAGRYPTEEEGLTALVERPATYPADKRWQKIMDKLPLFADRSFAKARIQAALCKQLVVPAFFHKLAVLQYADEVRLANGREAVGDYE